LVVEVFVLGGYVNAACLLSGCPEGFGLCFVVVDAVFLAIASANTSVSSDEPLPRKKRNKGGHPKGTTKAAKDIVTFSVDIMNLTRHFCLL